VSLGAGCRRSALLRNEGQAAPAEGKPEAAPGRMSGAQGQRDVAWFMPVFSGLAKTPLLPVSTREIKKT